VSTVSAGIAREMDRRYALPRPTLVVRKWPATTRSRTAAPCVTDLPISHVVREHDLGVLIRGEDRDAIAAAVNRLDRERWERESRHLVEACERIAAGDGLEAPRPRFH
jgi:hypothetical protein